MQKKLPDYAKELKPIVAQHGFVRKSSTWRRDNGWCIDIIEFQLSKGLGAFWINLGVLVKSVYSLACGHFPMPVSFATHHATVRAHQTWPVKVGAKRSWTDDEPWMEDAFSAIQNAALPFFDRMHNREEMKDYLRRDRDEGYHSVVCLAILLLEDGEAAEGCALLRRAKDVMPKAVAQITARWPCDGI